MPSPPWWCKLKLHRALYLDRFSSRPSSLVLIMVGGSGISMRPQFTVDPFLKPPAKWPKFRRGHLGAMVTLENEARSFPTETSKYQSASEHRDLWNWRPDQLFSGISKDRQPLQPNARAEREGWHPMLEKNLWIRETCVQRYSFHTKNLDSKGPRSIFVWEGTKNFPTSTTKTRSWVSL